MTPRRLRRRRPVKYPRTLLSPPQKTALLIVWATIGLAAGPNALLAQVHEGPESDPPSLETAVAGQDRMRYFLIGPLENAAAPEAGFKLLVVLPGGDGNADFNPFVRRILKNALGGDYLIAQPVAVKWRPDQPIVWPTRKNQVEGQKFSTEEFVEAVIRDVRARHKLDPRCLFTLSWSSSGPAAYATALTKDTPVTGSYIAMSVFNPKYLPPLDAAKGHAYFLEHSPSDRVCRFWMARRAERSLKEHGASVQLDTYEGGHGWHGDVYGRIRNGIAWLEASVAEEEPDASTPE